MALFRLAPLVLLSAVAYASTPANFWVGDDYNYIGPKGLDRVVGFFDPAVPSRAFYRPMNWTSWALDYFLYGITPFGWHVSSILIHTVAIIAIALAVLKLFNNWNLALLVGALFAVHPSHPETVTWIGGRADEVCGLFYFPALLFFVAYLRRRQEGKEGRADRSLYWLAFAMAAGTLLSKEMGVTIAAALLLTDFFFFTPEGRMRDPGYWQQRIRLHLPFILLVVAYGAMRYFLVAAHIVTNTYSGPSQLSLQGMINATTSNIMLAAGLWGGPLWVQSMPGPIKVLVLLAGLAVAAGLVRWLGRHAMYAVLWTVVTLLPTSNLSASRWMYIPSFGVCLLAGLVVVKLLEKRSTEEGLRRRVGYGFALLLVAGWGIAVVYENVLWHRSGEIARSLLTQVKALEPEPPRPATVYFSGAPANYKTALLFNTGLPSAMSLIYPTGGVDLHEVEQRLPDPVIQDALKTPPVLRPNPLFMGYSDGVVQEYSSMDQLLRATGKR